MSYHFTNEALKELDKNQVFLRNKKEINDYLKRGNEEEKTLNENSREYKIIYNNEYGFILERMET